MKNILRFTRNGGLRFGLITRFHHSQITLLYCSFMLMMLFCFLLMNGCKKDDPVLQGNEAFHAGAVAGYQALGAGVSYPFMALQIASPSGSNILNLSATKSILQSLLVATAFKNNSRLSNLPEYQPYLNLYTSSSITGNVGTANYYIDAAGTQFAGSLIITMPANVTNISDPTSYASYPANITIAVNLTAGNLPCKGNISLSFTDGTGANSMTGTLTLTKVNVVFSINLILDNQMNTTGSVTITESGATLEITNVQGKVTGPLTCDVKINPYGWTGTGTLDLNTGGMAVNINTGTGASTVTSDSFGNLNINYADGTHEIVIHAMSAELTDNGNSSDAIYNAPLIYIAGKRTITAINNKGQSVGYLGFNDVPVYWATPTAQPDTLHVPTGYDLVTPYNSVTPNSINDKGQIVGSGDNPDSGQPFALYWSSPTAQPQFLAVPKDAYQSEAYSINNSGQIVGTILTSPSPDALYWVSPNDMMPQVLQPLAGAYQGAFFIAPNGQIIGRIDVLMAEPFWASPKEPPVALSFLSGDSYANAMSVNASGVIVGYSGWQRPVTWASATKAAKALPLLSGSASGYAASINTAGVIVGSGGSSIYADGVIWQTDGQVKNLNTLIPSGNSYTLGGASLITDQGWILGLADNANPSLIGQYILIPK